MNIMHIIINDCNVATRFAFVRGDQSRLGFTIIAHHDDTAASPPPLAATQTTFTSNNENSVKDASRAYREEMVELCVGPERSRDRKVFNAGQFRTVCKHFEPVGSRLPVCSAFLLNSLLVSCSLFPAADLFLRPFIQTRPQDLKKVVDT